MPNYRAMVIHQGSSGLPRDRFVNNFTFSGVGTLETDGPVIFGYLDAFYNAIPAVGFSAPGIYLANVIESTEVRIYDTADAEPREPFMAGNIVLPSRNTANDVPTECAVVLSFYGDNPITPRRRGRIYFGPCCAGANTTTGMVAPMLVASLSQAASNLADHEQGVVPAWYVYSPSSGMYTRITRGHVDNAWDTQRRRGIGATDRNTWVSGQ